MGISDESVEEFKNIYKETSGKDISDKEAREAGENLVRFFDLLWKMSQEEAQLERRLKTEPDGFPVDNSYSCMVCGWSINETTGWYHWGGPRCQLCHKAIKDGVIPFFVLKHRKSYFSPWELKSSFNIHPQTVRKYVRLGTLKARIVLTEDGKPHEYIFLKKENPGLIERCSPERKSYDRNRAKVADKRSREMKKKMLEEMRETKRKLKKRTS